MGRGRPKAKLVVSPPERARLQEWTRRRSTAQALALRARIVLACAEGRDNTDVAEQLGSRIRRSANGDSGSWSVGWTACSTSHGQAVRVGSAMRRSRT